jgi:DNA-binding MarR family transcriptional regulator
MRRMTSFYEQYLRQADVKLSQYSLLAQLGEQPQSLLTLARGLEMDRTTLTRALAPVVRAGWAVECAGTDARQRLYVLSAEGRKARRRARAEWARAQRALEAQLGRDYVARLNAGLEDALQRLKPALPQEN